MSDDKQIDVWNDQFAKLPIGTIYETLKAHKRWPFPEGTLFLHYDKVKNGKEVVDHNIPVHDIEELDLCTMIHPEVIERLEKEYKDITGQQLAWNISTIATAVVNPRLFFLPDPAGGAILYAPVRERQGDTPGIAVAVYPIMLDEWRRFAEATKFDSDSWKSPGFEQTGTHPTVCISYLDVQKYLEWRNGGAQLPIGVPSEEDWLFAATKDDGRTYPWGEQDPSGAIGEELLQWSGHKTKNGTSSVYAHWRGMSPFGIHDMAGNVWEWTSTEHKG